MRLICQSDLYGGKYSNQQYFFSFKMCEPQSLNDVPVNLWEDDKLELALNKMNKMDKNCD